MRREQFCSDNVNVFFLFFSFARCSVGVPTSMICDIVPVGGSTMVQYST